MKAIREDGKEKQRYGQLSLDYMSEESSSSDEAKVVVHRPEWRSDGNVKFGSYSSQYYYVQVLNRFLQELDRRLCDTQKESKKYVPDRKQRIVGTPLASFPPANSPKWTISSDWMKGR